MSARVPASPAPSPSAIARRADEAALVDRARLGDEDAFAELIRLGAPAALGAARRITRDAALAQDAVQEAFLRAYRALGDYRQESSFVAWVRKIAVRTAIDLVRRRRPEDPLPEGSLAGASEEKRQEDADLLRVALSTLSVLDREILLAREVEGAGDAEVARRFEMTVTGVRVRMHRARKKLRARFLEGIS